MLLLMLSFLCCLLPATINALCVTGCATGQCTCFATFQECVTQDDANGLCTMSEAGIWLTLAIGVAFIGLVLLLMICLCCCCCCSSKRWCCYARKKQKEIIVVPSYSPLASSNKHHQRENNVALGDL